MLNSLRNSLIVLIKVVITYINWLKSLLFTRFNLLFWGLINELSIDKSVVLLPILNLLFNNEWF